MAHLLKQLGVVINASLARVMLLTDRSSRRSHNHLRGSVASLRRWEQYFTVITAAITALLHNISKNTDNLHAAAH